MNECSIAGGESLAELVRTAHGIDAVPFNEACMWREINDEPLFSPAFCAKRAQALGVAEETYRDKLNAYFGALGQLRPGGRVSLWFGEDAFCQMNLLAVSKHLSDLGYAGKATLFIVDETNGKILDRAEISPARFAPLYDKVLVNHVQAACDDARMNRGIALYFDYRDPNGRLAALAKQNGALGREFRVNLLLSLSAAYGITDRMAEELIG